MKAPTSTKIAYATAIGLVAFSGSVATYGMTKFCPGAEYVVAVMGLGFECGKVVSFSMLHKKMPTLLKAALLTVGLLLMVLNIVGVSGFMSAAYERQQLGARATAHTAESTAYASASLVERQLAAAESNLAAARAALIKARDDRGRQKAAQAIVASATAERDGLVQKLAAAQSTKAQAEGDTINSGAEFAAITFISGATGASTDSVAHAVILVISSIPDVLAVLLLLAAGYATKSTPTKSPAPRTRKPARRRIRRPALKVVPHAQPATA